MSSGLGRPLTLWRWLNGWVDRSQDTEGSVCFRFMSLFNWASSNSLDHSSPSAAFVQCFFTSLISPCSFHLSSFVSQSSSLYNFLSSLISLCLLDYPFLTHHFPLPSSNPLLCPLSSQHPLLSSFLSTFSCLLFLVDLT